MVRRGQPLNARPMPIAPATFTATDLPQMPVPLSRTSVTHEERGERYQTSWRPRPGALVVGLVGHNSIVPEDVELLKDRAAAQLERLRARHGDASKDAILLTALREGAETLVAELVTGKNPRVTGYKLVVLMRPTEVADVARRFSDPYEDRLVTLLGEAQEALVLQGAHAGRNHVTVSTLEPLAEVLPAQERARLEDESDLRIAVRRGSLFLAEQSHCLLACWDGVKTGGQELTSETVYQALDQRKLGTRRTAIKLRGQAVASEVVHLLTPHGKNGNPTHAAWSVRRLALPYVRVAAPLSTHERLLGAATMKVLLSVGCAVVATVFGSFGFYQYHKAQLQQEITGWDALYRGAALPLLEGLDVGRWRDASEDATFDPYPPGTAFPGQPPDGRNPATPAPTAPSTSGEAVSQAGGPQVSHQKPVRLEIPWQLEVARFFGVITPILVTFFGLHFWYLRKGQDLKITRWTLRSRDCRRPYAVICGLGWKGWELLHDLKRNNYHVAVVEKNAESPSLSAARDMKGVAVLVGDCTDPLLLKKLKPHKADKIFLVTGDEEINVRAAAAFAEEVETRWRQASDSDGRPRSWRVRCNTDMHGRGRIALLEATGHEKEGIELRAFSTEETTSRSLLKRHPIDRLLKKTVTQDGSVREAQVIILGDSPMARAILRLALHQTESGTRETLRLTVMAGDPVSAARDFLKRYPIYALEGQDGVLMTPRHVGDESFLNEGRWPLRPIPCWAPVNVHDQNSLDRRAAPDISPGPADRILPREQVLPVVEFRLLPEPGPVLLLDSSPLFALQSPSSAMSVFVCIDDGPANARWLQSFLPRLDRVRSQMNADTQVFYHFTAREHELPADFERHVSALAPRTPVTGFGDYLRECSARAVESQRLDIFAKLVHFCYFAPEKYLPEAGSCVPRLRGKKDFSEIQEGAEEQWSRATENDRNSSRMCADHLELKLRAIGIDTDDESVDWNVGHGSPLPVVYQDLATCVQNSMEPLSIMEHRRWCADRLLEGFRYASVRDKAALKHPALVPWDALTEKLKRKDLDLIRGIPQFLLDERLWRAGV